jgi:hypothetical protein
MIHWGARLQRGGPTIACPVTAARSEHPKVVLHRNGKKATIFDRDEPSRHVGCGTDWS